MSQLHQKKKKNDAYIPMSQNFDVEHLVYHESKVYNFQFHLITSTSKIHAYFQRRCDAP